MSRLARVALLALLAVPVATPAAGAYQLFPVRGLFFARSGAGTLIDEDFEAAVADRRQLFAERFRARFPSAATTISEQTQHRTFAVSLQISRASRFTSSRPSGTIDLYVVLTASVYFTSVTTGEVLFASTATHIKTTNVAGGAVAEPALATELFREAYRTLVEELVEDASKRFSPRTVSATVRKRWNDLAILDAGVEAGIASGDTLASDAGDAELKVVHAGDRYSVARVELGGFESGARFSKVSQGTLESLRKPRVLGLVEERPGSLPHDALLQIFADALGAKAPVSLVLVNPTFGEVLGSLKQQVAVSQARLSERPPPDLFVRVHVPEPVTWETPTNLAWKTLRETDALAYAELVDRSGRVLFAAQGRDRIRDEISHGAAIDLAARREIAVKNALLALAGKFATLKLDPAALDVVADGEVRDPGGVLVSGEPARAFRPIGRVSGVEGEVLVPTWEVDVTSAEAGAAKIAAVLPLVKDAPPPAKGDKVLLVAAPGKQVFRRRLGLCGPAERLGAVEVPGYAEFAANIFASSSPAPFFVTGLAARVRELISGETGFSTLLRLPEPRLDYCVQPVHRIDVIDRKCESKGCADVATVKLTYRIRDPARPLDVKFRRGMESRLTTGMLPAGASTEAHRQALAADLLDEIVKVASATAASFREEKL